MYFLLLFLSHTQLRITRGSVLWGPSVGEIELWSSWQAQPVLYPVCWLILTFSTSPSNRCVFGASLSSGLQVGAPFQPTSSRWVSRRARARWASEWVSGGGFGGTEWNGRCVTGARSWTLSLRKGRPWLAGMEALVHPLGLLSWLDSLWLWGLMD